MTWPAPQDPKTPPQAWPLGAVFFLLDIRAPALAGTRAPHPARSHRPDIKCIHVCKLSS